MLHFFRHWLLFFWGGWLFAIWSQTNEEYFYDFVVFFVVDQLRSESIPPYFQNRGFYFSNLHLPYSCTETAPGHATLLSGRLPKEHGIIANSWYEEKTRQIAALDSESKALGETNIAFSPKQFFGDHLSIYWKRQFPKSYFISISHKERSAVFLGGPKADLALAVSEKGVSSSNYYPLANLSFLEKINLSLKNFTAKSIDEKTVKLTEIVISHLNWENKPHFLAISLSELDILAHQKGYENPQVKEHLQLVFKLIQNFEKFLRQKFPKKKFLFFLTADHGSTTIEKEAQKFQKKPVRVTPSELYQNLWEKYPYLRETAITQAPHIYIDSPDLIDLARQILTNPHVYLVYLPKEKKYLSKNIPKTWQDLLLPPQEVQDLLENCFFEKRSPSLYVVLWPFVFLQDEKRQIYAGHGSPHITDRKIPLWIWGDGFSQKQEIKIKSSALLIAKTLAILNNLEYPHPAESSYLLPQSFLSRFKRR